MSRRRARLTDGSIGPQLRGLAVPMGIGLLSVVGFNLVDTWFIAGLGTEALTAIGFTIPVVLVVGGIGIGVGIGATAVLAQSIGRGDQQHASRLATHALVFAMLLSALLAAALLAGMDPLFTALGATPAQLGPIAEYMVVWSAAVPLFIGPMVAHGAMRASGDTRTPAAIMIGSMLVNVALDPVLIYGVGPVPAMGLRGAAIATVLARVLMIGADVYFLTQRHKLLQATSMAVGDVIASWRAVLRVGLPAAAAQLALPVSMGIVTRLVAAYGATAVAAFGVGMRIEALVVLPFAALAGGTTPFVGQNHGAGKADRIAAALRLGLSFCGIFGLAAWAVLAFGSSGIAEAFGGDPAMVATLTWLLIIAPAGYAARGALLVINSGLNATGSPRLATLLIVVRTPLLAVGLAVLGGTAWGVQGLFGGLAGADVIAGVAALGLASRRLLRA